MTPDSFQFTKKRLITEGLTTANSIRFNVIEYLCSFPSIDPVEMAASLQNAGYTILFDDAAISAKENAANKNKVNKAAREASQ